MSRKQFHAKYRAPSIMGARVGNQGKITIKEEPRKGGLKIP